MKKKKSVRKTNERTAYRGYQGKMKRRRKKAACRREIEKCSIYRRRNMAAEISAANQRRKNINKKSNEKAKSEKSA